MILFVHHYILKPLPIAILRQFLNFLIHLFEHFHKHLRPNLNLLHRIDFLSDIMAFMPTKQGTGMAYHVPASQADELFWLVVVYANLNLGDFDLYFNLLLFR